METLVSFRTLPMKVIEISCVLICKNSKVILIGSLIPSTVTWLSCFGFIVLPVMCCMCISSLCCMFFYMLLLTYMVPSSLNRGASRCGSENILASRKRSGGYLILCDLHTAVILEHFLFWTNIYQLCLKRIWFLIIKHWKFKQLFSKSSYCSLFILTLNGYVLFLFYKFGIKTSFKQSLW